MTETKVENSLLNAQNALGRLKEFLGYKVENDRDRCGVIQAFEFTFEATWKLFKKMSEENGKETPFPKKALSAAFQAGWLGSDEALWIDMLRDRNLTSHVYNIDTAHEIFQNIIQRYAAALTMAISNAEQEIKSRSLRLV